MRRMRYTGADTIVVSAAHSRTVNPGDVLDFDEVVKPRDSAAYSMEFALGSYASRFEQVAEEAPAAGAAEESPVEPAEESPTGDAVQDSPVDPPEEAPSTDRDPATDPSKRDKKKK